MIVLNSVEAADELLGKRSSNYSNRAVPHVAHDILRDGLGITFMEYGPSWKVCCGRSLVVARHTETLLLGPP